MALLENFQDVIVISFGAVVGANARFLIYKRLDKLFLSKNKIVLLINTSSSFLLGLFLSILSRIGSVIYAYQLALFFSIGLLGSLSTFSSFTYDLYDLFVQFKFHRAFKLFIISLACGLLAFSVGFLLFMP